MELSARSASARSPKSDESVSTRPARLHVPHNASLGDEAECRESLQKDLVVDFVRQVANEDVEVVGCVLLRGVVRLIGPVDADFLLESMLIHAPSAACALTLL
jgi:hypothetical protein